MKIATTRILAAGVVAIAWSCSSDNTTSSLVCGSGTTQQGNECVALTSGGDDAGDDVSTVLDAGSDVSLGPPPANIPYFAGVSAVAPSSTTTLFVAWNAAKDAVTPASQIVYRVYVATTAGAETFDKPTLVTPPGAESAELPSLKGGTPYFVVVRAVNQAGHEDPNAVEKSSKPEGDTKAPTFAGVTSATALGPASAELKWAAATDDKTPPEGIVYEARWSTSPSLAAQGTTGGVSSPGATSMIVTGLPSAQTTYYFVVRARDAANNRDPNTKGAAATTTADTVAPSFGGCTSVGTLTPGSAVVSWAAATDDATPQSNIVYTIFASTSPPGADGGFDMTKSASFAGVTSGRITGLTAGKDYYFVCQAKDAAGNQDKNLATVGGTTPTDTQPPLFNGLSVATAINSKKAEITWVPASDDRTPVDLILYDVYQGSAPGAEDLVTRVATSAPGANGITVTLQPGQTYYWVVRARDEAQNADDNTVEATLTAADVVSFSADIQPLLTRSCAHVGCHSAQGGAPQLGLAMDSGVAYANLVNVPAVQDEPGNTVNPLNRSRVKPADRDNSYLWLKITGTQPVGSAMPPASSGFQLLSQAEIDLIGNWIEQGAQNN